MHRTYIGDSVYVEFTEYGMIKLWTNNGLGDENIIYFEPEVFMNLIAFAKKIGWEKLLRSTHD